MKQSGTQMTILKYIHRSVWKDVFSQYPQIDPVWDLQKYFFIILLYLENLSLKIKKKFNVQGIKILFYFFICDCLKNRTKNFIALSTIVQ